MNRILRALYDRIFNADGATGAGDVLCALDSGRISRVSGAGVPDGWVLTRDSSVTPEGLTWTAGGGGGGAPTNAEYVVLTLTGGLSAERRLQVGSGLTLTDGGANADVTIGLDADLSAIAALAGTGIARRTGAGTWSVGTAVDLTSEVTGTLPVASGGTGDTTASGARSNLGAAPSTPSYVTLATNAELANERVLTAGTGIDITDGGAGGNVTISTEVAPPSTQVFSATTPGAWQTWTRPTGHTMMSIASYCGAGGGGGGHSAASGIDKRGGGGGGCGSIGRYCGPAKWATLEVQVGLGGTGGTAGNAGNNGSISYVSTSTNTDEDYLVLKSAQTVPTGGAAGGSGAGGGAGSAGSSPISNQTGKYSAHGVHGHQVGQAGGAGASATGGSNVTPQDGAPICGGAGGGGANAANAQGAGGNINAAGPTAQVLGGAAGGSAGNPGVTDATSTAWTGGSGGGGSAAGAGGDGGDGELGCGGGGGAGGTTGGTGGDGGDGWVEITSW